MIKCKTFETFDPSRVPSPCFVVDEVAVENNLRIFSAYRTGVWCQGVGALKAFSMFSLAPLFDPISEWHLCERPLRSALGSW